MTTNPRSLASILAVLPTMGLLFHASAAMAAEEPELQRLRVCDSSACYRAWNVVDSDHDGFADADEMAAGTDPFDAGSTPRLDLILDLIGLELLPTFELGVGELLVMPAEFQEMNERVASDPFAAFPLGDRRDSLKRAGIDAGLLTEHGIDAEFGGFTFTLGNEPDDAGPPRRVGGVDVRLIGNYVENDKVSGAVVFEVEFGDGNTRLYTDDGEEFEADLSAPWNSETEYVNPDDEFGGQPTEEALESFERLRNAISHVVEGWSQGIGSPDDILDKHATIILLDPEYANTMAQISGPPRVTTAQPETRPDLFNPLVPGGVCSTC
jgi:thrombospondin type 3 repeat protein